MFGRHPRLSAEFSSPGFAPRHALALLDLPSRLRATGLSRTTFSRDFLARRLLATRGLPHRWLSRSGPTGPDRVEAALEAVHRRTRRGVGDSVIEVQNTRFTSGLILAVTSATTFGLSGTIAKSLLDTGWSAGAAVTVRISIAALILLIPALIAMSGSFRLLRHRRVLGAMVVYGVIAVAVPQLCYFYAVMSLPVAVALLIEYTVPVAVVVWMWLRHGQRPTWLTVVGAVVAALGLALVLQVFGGLSLDAAGVAWALGAMVGAAGYFVLSAHAATEVPGLVLAAGGLVSAGVGLGLLGAVGILPMAASEHDVVLAGQQLPWWVAAGLLAVVTAALAYVTGIAATRRLGARLASFVALFEVVAAVIFAWALIGEVPTAVQFLGGALILLGVIAVKLGEREPLNLEESGVIAGA